MESAELLLELRLSLLKTKRDGIIPEVGSTSATEWALAKQQKEELDIRIDELEKLQKEMREN